MLLPLCLLLLLISFRHPLLSRAALSLVASQVETYCQTRQCVCVCVCVCVCTSSAWAGLRARKLGLLRAPRRSAPAGFGGSSRSARYTISNGSILRAPTVRLCLPGSPAVAPAATRLVQNSDVPPLLPRSYRVRLSRQACPSRTLAAPSFLRAPRYPATARVPTSLPYLPVISVC